MIALLLFMLLAVAFLAALGRNGIPRAERIPVWSWGFRDLGANLVLGARVMGLPERPARRPGRPRPRRRTLRPGSARARR